jgi:hypothetical protein
MPTKPASLLVLLAILATATSCVSRQTVAPEPPGPPSPVPEHLVARFADCVGVLGPVRDLPVAEAVHVEAEAVGEFILLSSPGFVSDGYYHWLRVQPVSGLVYIVQVGGIAGAQTVFGPFNAEHGCLAFPHRDRPPMLMELAWQSRWSGRDV